MTTLQFLNEARDRAGWPATSVSRDKMLLAVSPELGKPLRLKAGVTLEEALNAFAGKLREVGLRLQSNPKLAESFLEAIEQELADFLKKN